MEPDREGCDDPLDLSVKREGVENSRKARVACARFSQLQKIDRFECDEWDKQ